MPGMRTSDGPAREQRHERVHEAVREDQVDARSRGRGSTRSRAPTRGEQVQHDRADQRHEVGGDDRAERAPEARCRATSARSCRCAPRLSVVRSTRHSESTVTPTDTMMPVTPASVSVRFCVRRELRHEREEDHAGEPEAEPHHEAEQPVEEDHVERDEAEADEARRRCRPCSWSLPSVGDTLSTVCCFWSNCTGQRAVAQHQREVLAPRPGVKVPLICTSWPVMPWLIVGADCTTPSSSIATCLSTYGLRDLGDEVVVLEVTLTTQPCRRVVTARSRCSTLPAGEDRRSEEVATAVRGRLARLRRQHRGLVGLELAPRREDRLARGAGRERAWSSWSRRRAPGVVVVAPASPSSWRRGAAVGRGRRRAGRRRRVATTAACSARVPAAPLFAVVGVGGRRGGRWRVVVDPPAVVVAPFAVVVVAPGSAVVVVVPGDRACTGTKLRDRAEPELGGLADERQRLRAVLHAGEVDDDRVALAVDLGLGDAEGVDAVADDLDRGVRASRGRSPSPGRARSRCRPGGRGRAAGGCCRRASRRTRPGSATTVTVRSQT